VVHHAAQAAALAGVVALLAGCGGGEQESAPEVPGESSEIALTAREANCSDWNDATAEERGTLIDALEEAEGAPTTGGAPAVLPQERVYDLFENYCSESFASAFKLYKLYSRAQAFQTAP
jgi:hypothetical protein